MFTNLKKWLNKLITEQRKNNPQWLKDWIARHPSLLRWNCHGVAVGTAIGLFAALIPLPAQMLAAALLAILFRANVLIAMLVTWISNPITFIPINLLIYKVGTWVVGNNHMNNISSATFEFHWSWKNLSTFGQTLWMWVSSLSQAYLVGLGIVAVIAPILGYLFVQALWRLSDLRRKPKSK